ncbi:acyl-CoA synthetase [Amycolatopsis sp. CA-230715]|uniref:acyl-CoA synthetase n=1 Tax=Amycolatopsis sp. CA-230715 TaxID=2745196 RepID=UPI001C0202E4|nr:acyl-CoA synthetase [Amycolatopsis sp. CA-230715]QWF83834.1 Long-chain-fatty-acid--CoA ligase [Amycolatopsis sp. CA-230715]
MPRPAQGNSPLKKAADATLGLGVMFRSGLAPFPRVDDGIRSLLAVRQYGPFVGAVRHAARRHGGKTALVDERGELTYRELDDLSNALCRAWRARGIGVGAVFAALCRDHRGLVITMLAAGKTGARLVLMNTGFGARQLAEVAVRENVAALVYDQEFAGLLAEVDPALDRYLSWVDDPEDRATIGDAVPLTELIDGEVSDAGPPPEKPGGFVLLTSGTTGTPKGAPRERTSALASAQFLDRIPMRRGDTVYLAAPIFHGTGLSQFVLAFALGCKVVVHRRFDPEVALATLERHRCDVLVVVPTMLQRIVDTAEVHKGRFDTGTLRIVFAAGSSLSPDLCRRTADVFGEVLYNLYGSTEVAVVTVATPEDLRRAPGTVGRPPVTCRVALYDDEGNQITVPDRTGRVFAASGLSFAGYTDGATKEIVDGLLATGDVGHFDADGLLFIDGRDDDMIVSGGENVFPLEVENVLVEREDVVEAAVLGVPDEEFGQRLKAFVVPTEDASLDEEEVKAYVKENLARYKVPREVVFLEALPRNATGKVLRRKLSDY